MRADENKVTAAQRNREHMERVRAVHRRSAYERVVDRIARYEAVLRAAELELAAASTARLEADLTALRDQRARLWQEMVEAGQVAPGVGR